MVRTELKIGRSEGSDLVRCLGDSRHGVSDGDSEEVVPETLNPKPLNPSEAAVWVGGLAPWSPNPKP